MMLCFNPIYLASGARWCTDVFEFKSSDPEIDDKIANIWQSHIENIVKGTLVILLVLNIGQTLPVE